MSVEKEKMKDFKGCDEMLQVTRDILSLIKKYHYKDQVKILELVNTLVNSVLSRTSF
ncbi:hypothetical protein [Campylobacter sp. CCS1377]|uniref:Uncharacterized protein n=1 Tax=Campylobacter sp. CCS1377 TaxID=3158229 RepID=A0AAU7E5E1_9BACT